MRELWVWSVKYVAVTFGFDFIKLGCFELEGSKNRYFHVCNLICDPFELKGCKKKEYLRRWAKIFISNVCTLCCILINLSYPWSSWSIPVQLIQYVILTRIHFSKSWIFISKNHFLLLYRGHPSEKLKQININI